MARCFCWNFWFIIGLDLGQKFVGSNFNQFFVVIVDVRFDPLRNLSGFIYSFHPFTLFRKVKIADIILNFSFCLSIILDYFLDNGWYLFFYFLAIIFSLPSSLLLQQKAVVIKSYLLSFLFSIKLHYEISIDHRFLVSIFDGIFSVGIRVPLHYRPNLIIFFGISFYDAKIANCLFTTIYHVSTPDVILKFLGLLGLASRSSPLSVPCVSDLRVKWCGCSRQRKWLFKILFLRHILSLYSKTLILKEKPFNNCSPVFAFKKEKSVNWFSISILS